MVSVIGECVSGMEYSLRVVRAAVRPPDPHARQCGESEWCEARRNV